MLWQPGTDHAGIATQMVVERQLMERQEPGRREMGREKFLERVWAWKAEIRRHHRQPAQAARRVLRLVARALHDGRGLSRAVLKVFVELYNEGLIYKDKRLVNWDPKLLTAISDLEVQQVEVQGPPLAHPLSDRRKLQSETTNSSSSRRRVRRRCWATSRSRCIRTTRSYKHLIGKTAILPLVGRRIPIIADEYADPEKGTGAVKITPAHDFNDFEVGKRHDLPQISVLDVEGKLDTRTDNEAFLDGVPKSTDLDETHELHGVDRFEARKTIVERLEDVGLIDKIEPHTHMVPHGDRSNVVIEPYLTDQWYVNAKALAVDAIAAVREGKTSSCRRTGRRPISTGWRTSSRGASRGNCGGAIRFRRGTGRTEGVRRRVRG